MKKSKLVQANWRTGMHLTIKMKGVQGQPNTQMKTWVRVYKDRKRGGGGGGGFGCHADRNVHGEALARQCMPHAQL